MQTDALADPALPSDSCTLGSPVFNRFGSAVFRRAEGDGVASLVIPLGERLAVVPLWALQREFDIPDDSPDGRTLGLISRSLDYVAGLRIGDPIPPEVLTGAASWSPEPRHRAAAEARVRRHLLAGMDAEAAPATPERLRDEPALRAALQVCLKRVAASLGLAGGWQAALGLLEQIADELAYIEALRETLLLRVRAFSRQLGALGVDWRGDSDRQTTLTQVRRLAGIACDRLGARFAEIDRRVADVLGTLRDLDGYRHYIREQRDWLHRSRRAFEPILAEWEADGSLLDDAARPRLARAYQFLAPRFMPVHEWERATAQRPRAAPRVCGPVMHW